MLINSKSKETYLRLIRYALPYKWFLVLSVIASLAVSGTDVAIAWVSKPFVDKVIREGNITLMKLLPIGVILLYTVKGAARYFQEYFVKNAGQLAIQDIRNESFKHTMYLSMRYFAKQKTGVLMSRLLNDIGVVQRAISSNIIDLIREILTMLSLVIYAFVTDWKMALVTFVVVLATIGPASAIGKKIKKYSKRGQVAVGVLSSRVHQSFSGIKVIKAFGTEENEIRNFEKENWDLYLLFRKTFKYSAGTAPLMEILTSFGVAASLWYGFSRVISGEITQGELISIMVAAVMMYGPLKRLVKVNNAFQGALGAAERVFELIDTPIEIKDKKDALILPHVKGDVIFDRVSFAYDETPVLENFSAKVHAGEVIAFVGASGAGKTTIMGLLNRFFEPQSGSISIDGYDIKHVTQTSLHANMALVDQETFLFNDTIINNIRYSRPDASDEEVRDAARLAYADDFIMEMPENYESIIGDRGVRLSGGQRQRICIARAILRNAPILLLDEATSALDNESEAMVQKALVNLMKDRTTFVIAHRFSTIVHADRILVLDHGKIVEEGTHQDLLENDGYYRRLFEAQFEDRG